jgi:CDP-paratose synthetase
MSTGILITGASGYIASNLIKKLNETEFLFIEKSKMDITDSNNRVVQNLHNKFSNIHLLHLATHYSKNIKENDKIYEANILFGSKLLEKLNDINISKILYTNTMFNYYPDKTSRDLYYTQTKRDFSEIIEDFCNKNNINYEEIFLDNTFGLNDSRKKIVDVIIQSIKDREENPIINKETFINLIGVKNVIERLLISSKENVSYKSSFVSNKMVNINSIYEYLKHYSVNGVKEKDLLDYTENTYMNSAPQIDYKNIQISNIEDDLINLYDNYSY